MKKISFSGIGEVVATFLVDGQVEKGQVVKVTDSGAVGPCDAGDAVFGVAVAADNGYAAVQVAGFAEMRAAADPGAGLVKLSADGDGGVKEDGTAGKEFWVVDWDDAAKTAVVRL